MTLASDNRGYSDCQFAIRCHIEWLHIEAFITTELLPDAKGVAIFARGGAQPFFLPLQFRVPLPTWTAINSTSWPEIRG